MGGLSGPAEGGKSPASIVGEFRKALAECRAAEQRGDDDVYGPLGTVLEKFYVRSRSAIAGAIRPASTSSRA